MEGVVLELAKVAPWLPKALMYVGLARMIMKPIMTAVQEVVKVTPSQKDDVFLEKVLESKIYKGFSWVLDYVLSVKLPKVEEKK